MQCCSVILILKNCWFWFFNYSRIKRTTGSSYFKNLTEPVGFMKEPFDFLIFFENCGYVPKPILWIFWELVGKCMYTWADNWRVSTPNSRNHQSLGVSQHFLNNGSGECVCLCGGSYAGNVWSCYDSLQTSYCGCTILGFWLPSWTGSLSSMFSNFLCVFILRFTPGALSQRCQKNNLGFFFGFHWSWEVLVVCRGRDLCSLRVINNVFIGLMSGVTSHLRMQGN